MLAHRANSTPVTLAPPAGRAAMACLAALLVAPTVSAQSAIDAQPNPFAMTGDLLIARPLGLAMTAVGTAAFVVSLPLTALAGSVAESAEALVLGPAEATFVRCLGCIEPGYSNKDVDRRRLRRERKAAAATDGDGT